MAHYIDADRLRVEIDRQKIGYNINGKHAAEYDTCVKILRIIDSLQQEQPGLNWEDMVLLRTLFDVIDANQAMGTLTVQPMTREYYEYLLREFNEKRKK